MNQSAAKRPAMHETEALFLPKGHAQKRGSGKVPFSLDQMDGENQYLLEPATELTAEKIYDRRWATTLLDQAMAKLREECQHGQKIELFDQVARDR